MKAKPWGSTSPWDRVPLWREKPPLPPKFDPPRFKRATEGFKRATEATQRVGVEINLRQEEMVRKLVEMENQIQKLKAEERAQEERELQEGIDYVMRSLGVTP